MISITKSVSQFALVLQEMQATYPTILVAINFKFNQ